MSSTSTNQQISWSSATRMYPDDPHLDLEPLYPRFPPELEYYIFRLAWRSRKSTNLLCVEKRVRDWLIPLIYDLIIVNWSPGNLNSMLASLKRYGRHVHHLSFSRTLGDIQQSHILECCPNIRDLAYWGGGSISPAVYGLTGLKQLSFDTMGQLRLDNTPPSGSPSPHRPHTTVPRSTWFSNLTHMVVFDIYTPECIKLILQFPNLTHLMVNSLTVVDTLQILLRSRTKLKVVIWLLAQVTREGEIHVVDPNSSKAPRVDDPRVVTIDGRFSGVWLKAAKGEVKEDM